MAMHPDEHALEIAKEITTAAVGNAHTIPNAENGKDVAAFFRAIYDCALKAKLGDNDAG